MDPKTALLRQLLSRRRTQCCRHGHVMTPQSVSVQYCGKGFPYLQCRVCNRERARAHRLALKLQEAAA